VSLTATGGALTLGANSVTAGTDVTLSAALRAIIMQWAHHHGD
jgi:hypothetical protein